MKPARIERKTAIGMEELVRMYIDSMKISSGLNTQLIYSAWDQASGAADYTIKKYFRAGKLYVTLSSSVDSKYDTLISPVRSLAMRNPILDSSLVTAVIPV